MERVIRTLLAVALLLGQLAWPTPGSALRQRSDKAGLEEALAPSSLVGLEEGVREVPGMPDSRLDDPTVPEIMQGQAMVVRGLAKTAQLEGCVVCALYLAGSDVGVFAHFDGATAPNEDSYRRIHAELTRHGVDLASTPVSRVQLRGIENGVTRVLADGIVTQLKAHGLIAEETPVDQDFRGTVRHVMVDTWAGRLFDYEATVPPSPESQAYLRTYRPQPIGGQPLVIVEAAPRRTMLRPVYDLINDLNNELDVMSWAEQALRELPEEAFERWIPAHGTVEFFKVMLARQGQLAKRLQQFITEPQAARLDGEAFQIRIHQDHMQLEQLARDVAVDLRFLEDQRQYVPLEPPLDRYAETAINGLRVFHQRLETYLAQPAPWLATAGLEEPLLRLLEKEKPGAYGYVIPPEAAALAVLFVKQRLTDDGRWPVAFAVVVSNTAQADVLKQHGVSGDHIFPIAEGQYRGLDAWTDANAYVNEHAQEVIPLKRLLNRYDIYLTTEVGRLQGMLAELLSYLSFRPLADEAIKILSQEVARAHAILQQA